MASRATPLSFDVLLVGELRFPGGTSTAIAAEIEALAGAGYSVGLLAMSAPLLKRPHPVHPAIHAQLDAGNAQLVPQFQPVNARHCALHHPQVFEAYPATPPLVTTEDTVLVVHHPPVDGAGAANYDCARIARVAGDLFDPAGSAPVWAPVGPKVRQAFAAVSDPPPLTATDWLNVIDADTYAVPRAGFLGAVPVVGRHGRADPLKWPADRATFVQAYPDADDIRVRLMGWGAALDAVVDQRPANWQVMGWGALPVRQFLGSLDFYAHFHGPLWIEAFGRAIAEAMAAGAVPILPPDFAPLFVEGAVYCEAEGVADAIRGLHADPAAYRRQSEQAQAVVRERFAPAIAVARVADRIGPPATSRSQVPGTALPASPAARAVVLYLTSNGVGLGHLTRALASARRLGDAIRPVVVTMSRGFGVITEQGIEGDYLPYFRNVGLDEAAWHAALEAEVSELIAFHAPQVFVFDGNVPYSGLVQALARYPALWTVWQRRAMWAPDTGEVHIARQDAFDMVIEPGEIAAAMDRGLTRLHRDRTLLVPPIRFLRDDEAPDRATARAELGLAPDALTVLLQMGAGTNFDASAARRLIFDRLETAGVQLVLAEWIVGDGLPEAPPGLPRLTGYPFARYLAAFDASVAMAGYNTFHENLHAGLPTLFLANESAEQDEQWLRADYGALRGLCLAARVGNLPDLSRKLELLLDGGVRDRLRAACHALPRDNGADAVADQLTLLAAQRKTHRAG